MRLLLVEDDQMIGASLVRGLRDAGYTVDWVTDGVAAHAVLTDPEAGYIAALIDWGLPREDGVSVIAALRARDDTLPVIMITARDELADRVLGLDAGADDYLVKPFELAELLARLRTVLRRRSSRASREIMVGVLQLDPVTRTARLRGTQVGVTAREYALLHALMVDPNAVLSRSQLEERLYGWEDAVESNAVEVVIHGVRRKFGKESIDNLRGLGWRLGRLS